MKKEFVLSLVLTYALLSFASPTLALEKVRIATSVREVPLYVLPVYAAEDQGFAKEQGLELEYIPFTAGATLNRAVAAGAVDAALSTAMGIIQAIARGLPEIIVADMQAENPFSLWVLTISPIKEPRDLRGARIAVPNFGGAVHAYGRALAGALRLERDIRFVAAGGLPHQRAALKAGKVEGMIVAIAGAAPLRYTGEVRQLVSIRDFLPRDWTDLVVFAWNEFAGKQPETLRRTIKALLMGADYVQKNQDWAVKKMTSALLYQEGVAISIYPFLRYGKDGRINARGLENVRNFLVEYGILAREKAPALEALYSYKFLF